MPSQKWQQKEKVLSREEAVEKARKQVAHLWVGSAPLLYGVRGEDGVVKVFPLEAAGIEGATLFCFLDITKFSSMRLFACIREWQRRWKGFGVTLVVAIEPTYHFLQTKDILARFLEKLHLDVVFVLDFGALIAEGLGCAQRPATLLMVGGKIVFQFGADAWETRCEEAMQVFLRSRDPGLALHLLHVPDQKIARKDSGTVEFGAKTSSNHWPEGVACEDPKEALIYGATGIVHLHSYAFGFVTLQGTWFVGPEKISTKDPKAEMTFVAPGRCVSLIAETHTRTVEVSEIGIEVAGLPASEAMVGEHMTLDSMGESFLQVKQVQLYHMLVELPQSKRKIKLSFKNSHLAPLSIYGMRFGD